MVPVSLVSPERPICLDSPKLLASPTGEAECDPELRIRDCRRPPSPLFKETEESFITLPQDSEVGNPQIFHVSVLPTP